MIDHIFLKFSFATDDGGVEEIEFSASETAENVCKKTGRKLVGVQLLGPKYCIENVKGEK